ncbi:DNA cytosine methyltransferase [Empedobacter brevis]|uniref:DNA cytosine methyltransferase n=1 Tax=Empedobacter brevis TaxID=247 RepID=UPI0033408BA6
MRNALKVGSDFSGVGAFNQALNRLDVDYEEAFACDMNKYVRRVFIHNYGEPKYYPEDVYKREIPIESLDIYMTSPPCQAFSLAGKRKGEEDKRGILFYNSHEFIRENKPRYFIIENVKGLLSDDGGKTFARWIDYLGGKSVNGNPVIFPHKDSVPYHVYHKVLNAKNYGVPQNRERVFIIGIRDDTDNNFSFPKEIPLTKRLKDVLEKNVDEKYFLSDKMIKGLKGIDINDISKTIRVGGRSSKSDKHNWDLIKVGYINQDTQAIQVYSDVGIGQTLCAGTHGYANGYVQTFDTPKVKFQLTGGKWGKTHDQSGRVYDENGIAPTIHTMQGGNQEPKILNDYRIRKLTPRECFRLMDFPDSFDFSCVSDSQAYKQAGNSIVVNVLCEVLIKLLKIKKPR